MKELRIYKNMEITYNELDEAMKKLKFKKKIVKSNDEVKERLLGRPRFIIVYCREGDDYTFPIIQKPEDALVAKHTFVSLSVELEKFDFIKDYDDLAKFIEKNRLKAQKAAA